MSEVLNNPQVIEFTDTTALAAESIYIACGFVPRVVRVFTRNDSTRPVIEWNSAMDNVTAIAGGIKTTVVGGAPTRAEVAASAGVTEYAGGKMIKRNNPQTPTYQDAETATAVVAGSVQGPEGDLLALKLPALASGLSDDGKVLIVPAGVTLGTDSDIRGNNNVIRVECYR